MVCRVMRRHANPDYDWARELPGGEEYLDKLVLSLKHDSNMIGDAPSGAALSKDENRTAKDAESAHDDVNPRNMLDRAKSAMELAVKVVREAVLFSETPDRLSAGFVEESFPIDEDDGHHLYCVICGLAGDLLCCDGCRTVVHTDCIELKEPPAGDWFCEECTIARRASVGQISDQLLVTRSDGSVSYGPFKRANFDETALKSLASELHELRSKRPTQRVREARGRPGNDSEDESADGKPDKSLASSSPTKTTEVTKATPAETRLEGEMQITEGLDGENRKNATPSRRSKRNQPRKSPSAIRLDDKRQLTDRPNGDEGGNATQSRRSKRNQEWESPPKLKRRKLEDTDHESLPGTVERVSNIRTQPRRVLNVTICEIHDAETSKVGTRSSRRQALRSQSAGEA
jgi:PHD-finger